MFVHIVTLHKIINELIHVCPQRNSCIGSDKSVSKHYISVYFGEVFGTSSL